MFYDLFVNSLEDFEDCNYELTIHDYHCLNELNEAITNFLETHKYKENIRSFNEKTLIASQALKLSNYLKPEVRERLLSLSSREFENRFKFRRESLASTFSYFNTPKTVFLIEIISSISEPLNTIGDKVAPWIDILMSIDASYAYYMNP